MMLWIKPAGTGLSLVQPREWQEVPQEHIQDVAGEENLRVSFQSVEEFRSILGSNLPDFPYI